jgi:hypothetical protein
MHSISLLLAAKGVPHWMPYLFKDTLRVLL